MRNNVTTWLIGIVLLTVLAGYVDSVDRIGFPGFIIDRDTSTHLGLDLKGGLQLVLQAEPRGTQPITNDQLQAARNIIEDRANGTGASEPVVQTADQNRILVELPGITNLEDATKIIQETAFLEYIDGGSSPPSVGSLVCTSLGCPNPEQIRAAAGGATGGTRGSSTVITSTAATTSTAQTAAAAVPTPPSKVWNNVVTGDEIDGSKVAVQFDQVGKPQVSFTLKGEGSTKMANFTSANIGKFMPIVLDKKVISAPVIQGAIVGGTGQITGLTSSEAQKLAVQLKYGALPVGLRTLESQKISATLGQDAINKSVTAGIIGLSLVALFMMTYYRLPGLLASVALLIYSALAYAIFKLVPITLTLAGIAGFILSIGMAVDANVLIFSRLKEELRSGKTLGAAVEAGFDHAWPSIRDSNASTLITCAILFWFGSTFGGASIIKGFALTLAIGVAVSLFTAVTISRTFLRAIVKTGLSRSRWAFNLDPERPVAPAPTTGSSTLTGA
ncbi:MAG: protein translocase subunit SecD [Chloroflexota bacterium]|nr:protein translocase subunit SecD [Chloroflexota bacterium]